MAGYMVLIDHNTLRRRPYWRTLPLPHRGYGHTPIALDHKVDNLVKEKRLLTMFRQVDMAKNFYLSYTYDVTSTLQRHLTRVGASEHGLGFVGRFAWNHRMLVPAFGEDDGGVVKSPWAIPILHRHVDQASTSVSFPLPLGLVLVP